MTMKHLLYTVIAAATLLCGCENNEEMLTKEKDNIVKYLTSSRRLIAEEDVANSLEENPPFYSTYGQTAYRHITNYYDAERDQWSIIKPSSTIDIRFNAYIFTGSEPNISNIYWSNIPASISQIEASNSHPYDNLEWSEEPLTIQLGRGAILEGLEAALVGCHDQDSVQIYMTSSMAYGKHIIGSVPKNSSVAWYIKILNVTN